MKTPCMDCPNRRFGCHGVCVAYKEYVEMRKRILDAVHRENESVPIMIERRTRVMRKNRK